MTGSTTPKRTKRQLRDNQRAIELIHALERCVSLAHEMRADGVKIAGWPDLLASVEHVCGQFQSAVQGVTISARNE